MEADKIDIESYSAGFYDGRREIELFVTRYIIDTLGAQAAAEFSNSLELWKK